MANKMRLIDADALWHRTFICEDAADVRKEIETAPTVEAVEVVRCKECEHWEKNIFWCDKHSYYDEDEWKMFYENDFCSYGERRDDGR